MNRSGLLAWILPALLSSQTLDPGLLLKAPTAAWPTYKTTIPAGASAR